jgi:hypothetical protein
LLAAEIIRRQHLCCYIAILCIHVDWAIYDDSTLI